MSVPDLLIGQMDELAARYDGTRLDMICGAMGTLWRLSEEERLSNETNNDNDTDSDRTGVSELEERVQQDESDGGTLQPSDGETVEEGATVLAGQES